MAQTSPVNNLHEKWLEFYDRSLAYFYGVFGLFATVLGKDIIFSDKSVGELFKTGSVGSYYVLFATAILATFLLWYNYLSEVLFQMNVTLAKNDAKFRDWLLDKYRVRANKVFVAMSHLTLFVPPLLVLGYYNYDVGFGLDFSLFSFLARICIISYLIALGFRGSTLFRIQKTLGNFPVNKPE